MKKFKRLSLLALVIVSSAFAFDTFTKEDENTGEKDLQEGYQVGDKATDFNLKSTDDRMVSLNDFKKAKGFILVFTTNHCPYAKAYQDRIIALDQKYKSKGYPVIAINPNDTKDYPEDNFENMKIRARQAGFTFPYLMDKNQKIYPQYGATKTPHVYVLQKQNRDNIVKYIGAIDDNYQNANAVDHKYVESAVEALLQNKEVKIKTTKAIGCSIKS